MGRRNGKQRVTEEELRRAAEGLAIGWKKLSDPGPAANGAVPVPDDDEDEDPGYYTMRPWTEKGVSDDESEEAFIDEYRGSVFHFGDRPGRQRAGRFRAYLVRIGDADEAGIPMFDLFDAHSQTLLEYWTALFDLDTDDLKASLRAKHDVLQSDLLIIDYIQILPEHRGRGLGLAVASRLIDLYAGGCGLVALHPCPLQFNPGFPGDRRAAWWDARMRMDDLPKCRADATRRLRDHWRKLGFRPVGHSGVYVLATAHRRPRLKDICDTSML